MNNRRTCSSDQSSKSFYKREIVHLNQVLSYIHIGNFFSTGSSKYEVFGPRNMVFLHIIIESPEFKNNGDP